MNEITKPNDIFVATLNAPNASLLDFINNNITAENTSILTPQLYKETPFVKNSPRYNKNGVFNNDLFELDYLRAYMNYAQLSDKEAENNLAADLSYSPTDRYRPLGSKKYTPKPVFNPIINPLLLAKSISGINTIEAPTITKEEAAQSNFIFDPETGTFTDKTPETLSFWKKINGDTMVYAKYYADEIDPVTGQKHYAGEWKVDSNGNYYTEYLRNRELGKKQVVGLLDILTKEGSFLNKLDFFDSDDLEKSAWGVAVKTAVTMLPYVIPYIGPYYTALSTTFGLASTLPTFYKSLVTALTGEAEGPMSDAAIRAENWFRKFEPTMTETGKSGFFTLENMGNLVADTFSQLYQQRAAAKAARWFTANAPKKPVEATALAVAEYQQEYMEWAKRSNKLQEAFTLGYMGLISAVDVFNDAKNAGYDDRTAGIVSLASAAALYGVMNFNETTRGIGTWFLKRTTGYSLEASRGITKKVAIEEMNRFAKGVKAMQNGNSKPLADALQKFKEKVGLGIMETIAVGSENIWKLAIVEGVEEVTEEAAQDAIKGITDALAWLGFTPARGSFGGWSNVFSKEGLQRYVETFLGGAIGGGIFAGINNIENKFDPNFNPVKYTLQRAIIEGRGEEVIQEMANAKKYFNTRLTATLGTDDNGNLIYMSTADGGKSLADEIFDRAVAYVRSEILKITRATSGLNYDPHKFWVYSQINDIYLKSNFNENYTFKLWENLVQSVTDTLDKLDDLNKQLKLQEAANENTDSIKSQIKTTQNNLKLLLENLQNWGNGKNFADITLAALIYFNPDFYKHLLNLDFESYVKNKYHIDVQDLPPNGDTTLTQSNLLKEWLAYKNGMSADNILESLPRLVELLKASYPQILEELDAFVQNENNKLWLNTSGYYDSNGNLVKGKLNAEDSDNFYTGLIDYLQTHPKFWSLSARMKYDLADALISNGIIDISSFGDKQEIVKQMINDLASSDRVDVWTLEAVTTLLDKVDSLIATKDQENPFIKKLFELLKEDDEQPDVSNAQVDTPGRIMKHLDKFTDETATKQIANVKIASILDVVSEEDAFVDAELFNLLNNALAAEQLFYTQATINTILNQILDSQYTVLETLNSIVKQNLKYVWYIAETKYEYEINLKDFDFSGLTSSNVTAYIDALQKLSNRLNNIPNDISELAEDTSAPTQILKISDLKTLKVISNDLINAVQTSVLPEESLKKWELIQQKTTQENPLLRILKKIGRGFGVNIDDLITYLYNKSQGILNGTLAYELTEEDKKDLEDILHIVNFAHVLLACSLEESQLVGFETGLGAFPLSFNRVMLNYHKLYGNSAEADKYKVYSRTELYAANKILSDINELLWTLKELSNESIEYANRVDTQCRVLYTEELANKLLTFGLENTTIHLTIDRDEYTPEEFVMTALQLLHDLAASYLSTKEGRETLVTALIKKFPEAYFRDKTAVESVDPDSVYKIADSLMLETVLVAISVSLKDLNDKYIQGLSNKGLLPKFSQELAIKALIAHSINPELFTLVQEKLHDNLRNVAESESEALEKHKSAAYHLTRVTGGGGTGKSTMMRIYLDALAPKKVFLMAPTLEKVLELRTSYVLPENVLQNTEPKTIWDELCPGLNWDKVFNDAVQSTIQSAIEESEKSGEALNLDKISGTVTLQKGITAEFTIHVKDNAISSIELTSLKGDFKELCDKYKGATIIVDESTNIGLMTAVLDKIAANGAEVILLGDNAQIGNTISVNYNGSSSDIPFSSSNFFTNRTHKLFGNLRYNNSGKSVNMNLYHKLASQLTSEDTTIKFNSENQLVLAILHEFSSYKLLYNGLMGDLIANSELEFVNKLTEMQTYINSESKTFRVIYDGTEESKKLLKQLLKNAGIAPSIIGNDSTYKTLLSILGSEADIVVVYNLTTKKSGTPGEFYLDADMDIRRAYTALSRSKEFSLIYESSELGLFKKYGISSQFSDSVSQFTSNPNYDAQANAYIEQLKSRMQKLDLKSTIQEVTKDDEVETLLNTPIEESEALKLIEEPAPPELSKDVDSEETLQSTKNDENTLETPQDITTILKTVYGETDAFRIYCYYIRLGISLEQYNKLVKNERWKDEMNRLIANDTSETYVDLLGYFRENKDQYVTPYFSEFVLDFIAYRNKLLYGKINGDLYVHMKYKDDSDFAFFKPNNNEALETKKGATIKSVLKKAGDTKFYVTIGRIGFNEKNGSVFSSTLLLMEQRFVDNEATSMTWQLTGFRSNSTLRNNYYNQRSVSQKKSIFDHMTQGIILTHGLSEYTIDVKNALNKNLFGEKLTFPRGTVEQFKAMGWEVKVMPRFTDVDEFFDTLNDTRFEKLPDDKKSAFSEILQYSWVKVYPVGTNGSVYKLALLLAVSQQTVLQTLKVWNNTGLEISPYGLKQMFWYLGYLTGFTGFNGLSSKFYVKLGEKWTIVNDKIEKWKIALDNFLKSTELANFDSDRKLTKDLKNLLDNGLFDNIKHTSLKLTKSNIGTLLISILDSTDSIGALYSFMDKVRTIDGSDVLTRAYEHPQGIITLRESDNSQEVGEFLVKKDAPIIDLRPTEAVNVDEVLGNLEEKPLKNPEEDPVKENNEMELINILSQIKNTNSVSTEQGKKLKELKEMLKPSLFNQILKAQGLSSKIVSTINNNCK